MPPQRIRLSASEQKIQAQGFKLVIGIDEVGRGPLAGPVVAAAVLLKKRRFRVSIRDSKVMTPENRQEAFHEILNNAYIGVGIVSEVDIDQINILQATFLAMTNAVQQLMLRFSRDQKQIDNTSQICLLIDGNQFKSDLPYAYRTVIGGDAKILSIACASIVAKVTRDRILNMYDQIFPDYGFRRHKGYPTREHRMAMEKHGPSLIHRKSFQWTTSR